VLERAHHEAEWARLFQLGTRAAARDLGVPVTAVHRSLKIDSLSWEAKAAAITHELDDNQSALEDAAEKTTWEEQVEVLKRRAEKAVAAKRARASKPRKPNPETAPQPEPTPESDEPADDVESKPTCATAKQRPMPEHLRPICTALWKLKKRDRSYIWYFLISNWRRDRAPEPQPEPESVDVRKAPTDHSSPPESAEDFDRYRKAIALRAGYVVGLEQLYAPGAGTKDLVAACRAASAAWERLAVLMEQDRDPSRRATGGRRA
jgi:hypothetical protein